MHVLVWLVSSWCLLSFCPLSLGGMVEENGEGNNNRLTTGCQQERRTHPPAAVILPIAIPPIPPAAIIYPVVTHGSGSAQPRAEQRTVDVRERCPLCKMVYGTILTERNGLLRHDKAQLRPCGHHICWVCAKKLWLGVLTPLCPIAGCCEDLATAIRDREPGDLQAILNARTT